MDDPVPITVCTESDVHRALDQIDAGTAPSWSAIIEEHVVDEGLSWTPADAPGAEYTMVAVPRMEIDNMVDEQTAISISGIAAQKVRRSLCVTGAQLHLLTKVFERCALGLVCDAASAWGCQRLKFRPEFYGLSQESGPSCAGVSKEYGH